ncbi:MAG: cytochrome c oxidase subunit II [Rhodospirillaceae bacterium]|nr:cytochrome c oxidase subunit II [Rhodospirillaceae bacterium]MCY4239084.1 cytochrome c oxidase subunit II [Rhodospirillaceae bacterium]
MTFPFRLARNAASALLIRAGFGMLMIVGAGASAAGAAQPEPWQTGFQKAATPVMERVDDFHDLLLIIISLISVFVLVLLIMVVVRFRESKNPTPSKTTHNLMLEVAWTVVPVLILVVIAVPSFRLLYYTDKAPKLTRAEVAAGKKIMTVKATGHQWYWSYEYTTPEGGKLRFESRIACRGYIDPENRRECQAASKRMQDKYARKVVRLLDVDNEMVLPVSATVRLYVTGADVIHSWTIPASGAKIDAVPGQTNETWVRFAKPGWFYGQCSEICGKDHAFMPIALRVVSEEEYQAWLAEAWNKAREESDGFSVIRAPEKTALRQAPAAAIETAGKQ